MIRFYCWTVPILILDGVLLILFVLCLSIGFARFGYYYWKTDRISCRYAQDSRRQTLDVYCSVSSSSGSQHESFLLQPVVVFFTGGAWMIGYKLWGALLARALTATDCLCILPDYRNYPFATVPEAVQDVEAALKWIVQNCPEYGGDPNKIVVVGQSAGGHLAMTALLRMALRRTSTNTSSDTADDIRDDSKDDDCPADDEPRLPTSTNEQEAQTPLEATNFSGFIALSSPYCLTAMEGSFRRHGLDDDLVDRIFGGKGDAYNPMAIVADCIARNVSLADLLPPIHIYHGTRDKTVPHDGSVAFVQALQTAGAANVDFTSYENWSHTDAILEGPMDADHRFHRDIHRAVQEWTENAAADWPDPDSPILRRLCPHVLVQLGRFVNPF